jgi:hypothetical protein
MLKSIPAAVVDHKFAAAVFEPLYIISNVVPVLIVVTLFVSDLYNL